MHCVLSTLHYTVYSAPFKLQDSAGLSTIYTSYFVLFAIQKLLIEFLPLITVLALLHFLNLNVIKGQKKNCPDDTNELEAEDFQCSCDITRADAHIVLADCSEEIWHFCSQGCSHPIVAFIAIV